MKNTAKQAGSVAVSGARNFAKGVRDGASGSSSA